MTCPTRSISLTHTHHQNLLALFLLRMADPDNEPDFYAIDRLFPLADGNNNNKLALGNQLLGGGCFGGQNALLGGLGNFQQLPPGLLAMTAPSAAPRGMNQGPLGSGNFSLNSMGNLMLPPLQQQQQQQTQAPNMNDPTLLAAFLQQTSQQQQLQIQQPMSTQRAQSSLLRFM